MGDRLTSADYAVLLIYLIGTIALGMYIGRRMKTGQDYFLAGRTLPWWAIGLSLVATDIGGTDIIGVGGAAYSFGLAVANFEWIGCVPAMIVAAFVFIPHFWRTGVYTIPEFMERRFHVSVRTALAGCWLLFMACNLGIMLYASAKMVVVALDLNFGGSGGDAFLAGREMAACILAVALVAGIYTLAGGLAAVVYTDTIQCVVMIGGCLMVLVIGLWQVGGVDALRQRIADREQQMQTDAASTSGAAATSERTELILPVNTAGPFPWTGILFGLALVLSPAYWIGNQAIVQRSLGARSARQAQAAYVCGALLKNVIPVIIAVPGLVAFALLPDLPDGDHAFPELATRLLPSGLRGVFLAAFLAALMSSVDSYLNAASTILTKDLYQRFHRGTLSDERVLRIGRLATLGLLLWAVLFALYSSRVEEAGIYALFQTLMSFFQGPALALLLAGVFWGRANAAGALTGFLTGIATAIALFSLNSPTVYTWLGWQPLFQIAEPFLYYSVWSFLAAAATLVVVSLCTRPPRPAEVEPLLYRRARSTT